MGLLAGIGVAAVIWLVKSDTSGLEVTAHYAKHGFRLTGKYVEGDIAFNTVYWSRDNDHEETRPKLILAGRQPGVSLDELNQVEAQSWISENYTEQTANGLTDCIGFVPMGSPSRAYGRLWWSDKQLSAIYVSEGLPKTLDGKTEGSFEILAFKEGAIRLPMRKVDADRLLGAPSNVEETRIFP